MSLIENTVKEKNMSVALLNRMNKKDYSQNININNNKLENNKNKFYKKKELMIKQKLFLLS